MSVVGKLKRLHKQFLLKIDDIQRAMIAKAAGVDNETYLNRARTLKDFLDPKKGTTEEELEKQEAEVSNGVVGSLEESVPSSENDVKGESSDTVNDKEEYKL